MRTCFIILAALLISACDSDDNSADSTSNTGKDQYYASKALGPTQLNNTVTLALMVTPDDTTETVTGQPAVHFDQQSGELTIEQGQGIRAAEATFLLTSDQILKGESCGYLETIDQPDAGCILTVSATDLGNVHLSGVQLFDPQGNLIHNSIE